MIYFAELLVRITVRVKFVSEFVYELPKSPIVPKCPVCGLSGLSRKRDAAFTASREYVSVQVLMELKCAVVCYFQGRIYNPTNLLNHVTPPVELIVQI